MLVIGHVTKTALRIDPMRDNPNFGLYVILWCLSHFGD
jgi:hypothetical protein